MERPLACIRATHRKCQRCIGLAEAVVCAIVSCMNTDITAATDLVLTPAMRNKLIRLQQDEANGTLLYRELARVEKNPKMVTVLERLARDEHEHWHILQDVTQNTSIRPDRWKVKWQVWFARLLGITFTLKWLERDETKMSKIYEQLGGEFPLLLKLKASEDEHEHVLLEMLDDEHLSYMGAIVLGLNDALVELTGALAGLTFALGNSRLIAMTGLITGLSAAMSMAASGFLAAREEESSNKHPLKSALYTGVAYVITVILLIMPYLLMPGAHPMIALGCMLAIALVIIAVFNYYVSVARTVPFKSRFWEMAGISLTVTAISFLIGVALNHFFPNLA